MVTWPQLDDWGRYPIEKEQSTRFSLRGLFITITAIALAIAGMLGLRNALEWQPPPIAVTTRIPGTNATIQLRGPDMKRHYSYDVVTDDGQAIHRFLGPIWDESLEPVLVKSEGDGLIRVQWGTSPYAGFCILNVHDGLVVCDANMANLPNEPYANPPASERSKYVPNDG